MAFLFSDLQTEVLRRAAREQGGTQFTTGIKNLINSSLFRVSREAYWRPLRRKATFATKAEYTTGTLTATEDSNSFTGSGINWLTEGVQVGRRISISGSSQPYIVATITGENAFTTNLSYDGTTDSAATYVLYGQEEYNIPIQAGRPAFLWHEDLSTPRVLQYVPDFSFYSSGASLPVGSTPTHYRMWGENDVINQPIAASVIRITSSVSTDTSIGIQVFGIVSGYPDFEVIATNASNGTTAVSGSKSFTSVDRVVKSASTTGRITLDANTAQTIVAVLPVGHSTGTIQYKKVQLYPLPTRTFNVNVEYYKDPWRLVNSTDIHELGQDFDEAIILLSVCKLKAENSQSEAQAWAAMYTDEVASLKKVNADKPDWLITLEPSGRRSYGLHGLVDYSQLGGNYGASSRW